MEFDRIRFQIKETSAGFVVVEHRYAGASLVSVKELGIVHARKADAIKAIDSLRNLIGRSSPQAEVEAITS